MSRFHLSLEWVFPVGTQVVTQVAVVLAGKTMHPRGAVGVVVHAPSDNDHSYRVRFPDGYEAALKKNELVLLAHLKEGQIGHAEESAAKSDMYRRVILRCIIGSQAYGLSGDDSDVDRRGIYLPPAELHWSLFGVPEQLENNDTQEAYWELQKFLVMALKANPNVLECLYSPRIEHATPLARELLSMRECFLSRLVYQTYNGYVMSQFKKMQADLRNHGKVKWKHVMHLLRLLLAGIEVLKTGSLPVHVGEQRERLLAIRQGLTAWDEVEAWRQTLHHQFTAAYEQTRLPERPDYDRASAFLVKSRRLALAEELP
jgi:uncharacterized protein